MRAFTSALLVCCAALCITPTAGVRPAELQVPPRIADRAFWDLIVDFSEPSGFFRSDNLVSNETTFQRVIPALQQQIAPGGVYLGVGPDQNFTYIAALRPKIAFIVDIRRQNMLLHLMYKAIVEASTDRADFLSRLFSRERPAGLGPASSARLLLASYRSATPDEALFEANLRTVVHRLVKQHKFALSADDLRSIEYVYRAFYTGGPDLRYSFGRYGGWQAFPTYADLMSETDGLGVPRSYLASEENFHVLRDLEQKNLIVPIVGNFAGRRALRSVGHYLKERRATVTAFYTSNVEQYLFQGDDWRRFFSNVATLPLDRSSTFIRAYFNNAGYRFQMPGPSLRSATLLDPMVDLLSAFDEGRIQTYYDVIEQSR